jgi:hypothetical protein
VQLAKKAASWDPVADLLIQRKRVPAGTITDANAGRHHPQRQIGSAGPHACLWTTSSAKRGPHGPRFDQ